MEEKIIENDIIKGTLKKMADEDDAVYHRKKTEYFMRGFWILAGVGIFLLNYHLLDSSTLMAHIFSFIQGIMMVKVWQLITPYMDLAEEVGLVIPEDEIEE